MTTEEIVLKSSISQELKNKWLKSQRDRRSKSRAIAQRSPKRVQELELTILKLKRK